MDTGFSSVRILILHRLIASFGGAHKYLEGLIERLLDKGWEVHLAVNVNPDIDPLTDRLAEMGAALHRFEFDALTPRAAGAALDQLLAEVAPDTIDFESAATSMRELVLNSKSFMFLCNFLSER